MDVVETAVIGYVALTIIKRRKRKNRRHWVNPINSERLSQGDYYTLFNKLRADRDKFLNHFRMSEESFYELLCKLHDYIKGEDTTMRCAIPPGEMLAVTLRYLATGSSFTQMHYSYRIGKSTANKIVRIVCQKIWLIMKDECIPAPSEIMWRQISEGFRIKASFPNCIGAVDEKHIRIKKPGRSATMFYNYKNFVSISLMAVADSNYKFVFVDVVPYGKDSDATILKQSSLWRHLQNKNLQIPSPELVPGMEIPIPYAFVADEAFGLSDHILRPYSGQSLEREKLIFNCRLSRAKRYVECAFGILSNKWRIFHKAMEVQLNFADEIVKCCCVLHNFVRERDGFNFEDTLTIHGLVNCDAEENVCVNRHTNMYREALANYFDSEEGKVP